MTCVRCGVCDVCERCEVDHTPMCLITITRFVNQMCLSLKSVVFQSHTTLPAVPAIFHNVNFFYCMNLNSFHM